MITQWKRNFSLDKRLTTFTLLCKLCQCKQALSTDSAKFLKLRWDVYVYNANSSLKRSKLLCIQRTAKEHCSKLLLIPLFYYSLFYFCLSLPIYWTIRLCFPVPIVNSQWTPFAQIPDRNKRKCVGKLGIKNSYIQNCIQ